MTTENTAAPIKAADLPAIDANGNFKETFFFRPKKEKDGTTIPARAPFTAYLPYFAEIDGVANKAEDSKLIALLQDETKFAAVTKYLVTLVNDSIYTAAQGQVNAAIAAGKELVQDVLNLEVLDIYALATAVAAAPKRGGIPKELWTEFKADLMAVLQSAAGVSIAGSENVARFLGDDKLVSVQTNKDLLTKLHSYLNVWFDKTAAENQEKFLVIYEMLNSRADDFLGKTEQDLLSSID